MQMNVHNYTKGHADSGPAVVSEQPQSSRVGGPHSDLDLEPRKTRRPEHAGSWRSAARLARGRATACVDS